MERRASCVIAWRWRGAGRRRPGRLFSAPLPRGRGRVATSGTAGSRQRCAALDPAHAILAPHSHNLQSWRCGPATAGRDRAVSRPHRLLPETDPFSRQIMMIRALSSKCWT